MFLFFGAAQADFGRHKLVLYDSLSRQCGYYDKYNRRDSAARTQMYELIENDPRNRLDRTFKDVVA